MFDLFNYNEIINHLHYISKIYKVNSTQDWIQILCPYCDDAYRKSHIDHGHFYISRFFNFGQCFRCDKKISIKKFLIETNFKDINLLNLIFKNSNLEITYNKNHIDVFNSNDIVLKHKNFIKSNYKLYNLFLDYIKLRIGDVDFNTFSIYPFIINNNLTATFDTFYGNKSISRFINNPSKRYYRHSSTYFFQNPLDDYNEIIVTEGAIDLINIYKYSTQFVNKSFYIAINGKSYLSEISNVISENFMIGTYTLNIIFDNDILNISQIKYKLSNSINILNPNIKIKTFKPNKFKDVSDCIIIEEV